MATIEDKIKKVISAEEAFKAACKEIEKDAQKHITWNKNVAVVYSSAHGTVISIGGQLCKLDKFFSLAETYPEISMDLYLQNCIRV
jgi:hypothetical protein